jgi:hypothetical protein
MEIQPAGDGEFNTSRPELGCIEYDQRPPKKPGDWEEMFVGISG